MKIGIIGAYNYMVPPENGKIHAPLYLAWELAKKLADFGHDVTYFGAIGNGVQKKYPDLKFRNPEYFEIDNNIKNSPGTDAVWQQAKIIYQQGYLAKVLNQASDFDLFYSWAASQIGPLAEMCKKPVVTTHHDSTNIDRYNLMFRSFASSNVFLIPISEYIKNRIVYKNMLEVVHHGVDQEQISFVEPENYFCWVGRVAPSKGLHIAIEVAKKTGIKLKIAGPMFEKLPDFGDTANYNSKIAESIKKNDNIEYLGHLLQHETYELVSKAKGLIFPTDGTESFSMITAEAIMAGTPVISVAKGPIPEIITSGLNGFLIDDENNIDGFVEAINNINQIDRKICREDAIKRFSIEKMARGYEKQFQIALNKWSSNVKN